MAPFEQVVHDLIAGDVAIVEYVDFHAETPEGPDQFLSCPGAEPLGGHNAHV